MTVRVLLAEDHPMFREGLRALLETLDGVEVVGAYETGEQVVEAAQAVPVDVVVLDLEMPGEGGLAAAARLAKLTPAPRVLVLSAHDDDAAVYTALRHGAHGYLMKSASPEELTRAVLSVAAGTGVYSATVVERITRHVSTGGRQTSAAVFPQLTDRERQVLDLMARGWSNSHIADHFVLSLKTVRNHVSAVLAKLDATSRTEAVVLARRAGLGEEPV